jgi:hypothetical protein
MRKGKRGKVPSTLMTFSIRLLLPLFLRMLMKGKEKFLFKVHFKLQHEEVHEMKQGRKKSYVTTIKNFLQTSEQTAGEK